MNVREQMLQRLDLAFRAAHRKLGASAFDEVIEIALRMRERFLVSVFAFAANEQVGIEAGFEANCKLAEIFGEAVASVGGAWGLLPDFDVRI